MAKRIKGYTRSDGTKVKSHPRKSNKRYTPAQKRALEKSKTSKSGHKTVKQRSKTRKPGLWTNVWNKRKREGKWKPKPKRK